MVGESETPTLRLRRKLTELSNEYSPEKQVHPRSKSASSRAPPTDPNASLRYRRMRRKVDDLRTQIDAALQDNYLSPSSPPPLPPKEFSVPTRDTHHHHHQSLKKKAEEYSLVTGELIQVLHSKQTKIDELEQRLKDMEQQESQWKNKYERECRQRDALQSRVGDLEKELLNRQHQSTLLGQLQVDIQRLHHAFDALEAENSQLNAQLVLAQASHPSSVQFEKFRHDIAQVCHESLC